MILESFKIVAILKEKLKLLIRDNIRVRSITHLLESLNDLQHTSERFHTSVCFHALSCDFNVRIIPHIIM